MNRAPGTLPCKSCKKPKKPEKARTAIFQNFNTRSMVAERYQSYPGIVHGGILASMLDEVIGRVAMIGDHHHFMVSVKLQILYRHPVPVETPLKIRGRIIKLRGRLGKAPACHLRRRTDQIPDQSRPDRHGQSDWRQLPRRCNRRQRRDHGCHEPAYT